MTEEKKNIIGEFFDFLKTFGVIGLALAFIIGQASSKLVTAFVDDIVSPFIGLFLPEGELEEMKTVIGNSEFLWGDLLTNIIDFVIIAFIIFLAYKQLSRMKLVEDKTKKSAGK